jgi:hypothetical protein
MSTTMKYAINTTMRQLLFLRQQNAAFKCMAAGENVRYCQVKTKRPQVLCCGLLRNPGSVLSTTNIPIKVRERTHITGPGTDGSQSANSFGEMLMLDFHISDVS